MRDGLEICDEMRTVSMPVGAKEAVEEVEVHI